MSFLNHFLQNIADICGVPRDSIQQDGENIVVGTNMLPLIGVFFTPPDGSASCTSQLIDFFDAYDQDTTTVGKILPKDLNNNTLHVSGLNVLNQGIDAGVYEISGIDGKRSVVFTGSFAETPGNPDLTSFPEVLLAIAVLHRIRCVDSVNWACVIEGLGPFLVYSADPPLLSLGECGLTVRRQNTFSFTWNNTVPSVVQSRKAGIPEEAEAAYIAALQDSATADVAFLRLYRVLEILFAGTYRDEIANADLGRVIALIQSFQSTSELDTLKKLMDRSNTAFIRFTNRDFDILFDNHRPQGRYIKITEWLNGTTVIPSPIGIRVHIIYYVRCALVHSKMSDKEPFLIGPFSHDQEEALKHLVEDTRDIVKNLLF